jgi:hypothetical protein
MVAAVVLGDLFLLWPAGSAGKNNIRVQDSKVLALAPSRQLIFKWRGVNFEKDLITDI